MLLPSQEEFLRSMLTRVRGRDAAVVTRRAPVLLGDGEARSGAGPDARDPAGLGSAIGKLVVNRGWDLQLTTGALHGRWTELVGSDVADHVTIETFSLDPGAGAGVLVLRADSTAWATQMRLMVATLQARLEEEVGAGRISEIVVNGPAAPSWKHGPRSVSGRGPRDTYG